MKTIFYIGITCLGLFEILNVYFIMPMPGSQQWNTVEIAYFMYTYRWFFRILFALMATAGSISAFNVQRKWIPMLALLSVVAILCFFNFRMKADQMFLQPQKLVFKSRTENNLNDSSIVVAVSRDGESKAYPIRYIQYHHQVRDTLGGKPIMVTYCIVCRTGRVFAPVVKDKVENFRLVGMDHFNAIFEDETTKSWWRQATGEAVAGSLKGNVLPEVESSQLALNTFFALYPFGQVMQAEDLSKSKYDTLGRFEKGRSKSKLTRTDSVSWKDKSWVLGLEVNGHSKAYDWIDLKKHRIVNDQVGDTPVVIAIASDDQSFVAFKRAKNDQFELRNDSLINGQKAYNLLGRESDGSRLVPVNAYQEFWHSWRQFHPATEVYE
jgi:hypothetical protein